MKSDDHIRFHENPSTISKVVMRRGEGATHTEKRGSTDAIHVFALPVRRI
jgi:hypothetical protein